MERIWFAACAARGLNMTPEQLQTLADSIVAETDPKFVEARTIGQTSGMAAFYNAEASPAFYIWRKNYTPDLIADAIDNGITQLDGLTASKRDSLLWWANRQRDASLAGTQAAINDLCGSQNTLKAAVLNGGKRKLTRGEKLYSAGTGSLASPGITGLEGTITDADISAALEILQ